MNNITSAVLLGGWTPKVKKLTGRERLSTSGVIFRVEDKYGSSIDNKTYAASYTRRALAELFGLTLGICLIAFFLLIGIVDVLAAFSLSQIF